MAAAKTGKRNGLSRVGSSTGRGRIVLFIEMFAGRRRGILHAGPDGSGLELVDSDAAA
jgi:hypothetical protein